MMSHQCGHERIGTITEFVRETLDASACNRRDAGVAAQRERNRGSAYAGTICDVLKADGIVHSTSLVTNGSSQRKPPGNVSPVSLLSSQPTRGAIAGAENLQTSGGATPVAETFPPLPEVIGDEPELDDWLTRPRPALVDFIQSASSPLMILGAGGKMGPTLAVLAKRAAALAGKHLDVIAVSRFPDESSKRWLESCGVLTLRADLLERDAVRKLPNAADVIYLVGLKFGTGENPALTWAANTLAPTHVAERFAQSRLVALSTGNVYPLVPVMSGGAREDHALTPLGEYPNAAVARERIFEYFAHKHGTRIALVRLNYAVDLRYGVLTDIARKVHAGEPVDVTSGYFNCIWQGDANDMILRTLELATHPSAAFNLTGPNVVSVRQVATRFSELFGRPAHLVGAEADTALLNNAAALCRILGPPPTALDTMIRWTAHWVRNGGRTLDRPTHFEVRDGKY